ncbi:hypothetical protein BBK36DRAFT_1114852 [Trichoderma citrinoviride]|uniref:Uncharacterized protein n=1 Tax=Trichoderma citrinoviride TaxID=58853 RepID=A0A2T4BFX5_9HYPO|nr:hypothetical protein BBK36DRAFT_1114852 [Trichoderma citrinoviride]PTB68230.1 hypothetical protein BBK36DRAFT_1114852 [Trichoderma citrinoviride]
MPPRRREIPPESSWRLVEGENDSFDTSIIDPSLDDELSPPSSAVPSSGLPTQSFSQSMSSMDSAGFGSQDSIRDFANFQNEEDVILREPFRPTVPSSVATSQRTSYPRPDMQFRMPLVEANNLVASEASRSARTADEDTEEGSVWDDEQEHLQRDEGDPRPGWDSEGEYAKLLKQQNEANGSYGASSSSRSSFSGRLLRVLRYTAIPAAIVMAAYLFHTNGISLDIARDRIQSFSLKSLHDIPSVSNFQMPFFEVETSGRAASASFIDFTSLMDVQSGFESVLDKMTQGLAMPRELKESEMVTRNLRSLLKTSEGAGSEDLMSELNGYIEKVGRAAAAMQTFHIHVGSTVDSVININRWTLRHINSLSMEPEAPTLPPVIAWAIRPLSIFRSSRQDGNDKALWDKYSEHVVLVQDRLDKLLEEGKALSLLLHQGQAHLSAINEQAEERLSSAGGKARPSSGSSFLSGVWAYLGRFVEDRHSFREEIALLKKANAQYAAILSHLLSLIENLKDIQLYLGDLLKRDASSSVVWADEAGAQQQTTTLGEQYEIIKNALERLERAREKAAEGEKQHEAEPSSQQEAETKRPKDADDADAETKEDDAM